MPIYDRASGKEYVEHRLETVGAKNKQYDADLDGVIDSAIGTPPVYIKQRTDGSYVKLELGTITTLANGQSLNSKTATDTETSYTEVASYADLFYTKSTSYVDDYDFGTLSTYANKNELVSTIVKFQADLYARRVPQCDYTRSHTVYSRLLEDGVEKVVLSAAGANAGTKSAEFETTKTSANYKTQLRTTDDSEDRGACIRNRYIYMKKRYYKIQIYN